MKSTDLVAVAKLEIPAEIAFAQAGFRSPGD